MIEHEQTDDAGFTLLEMIVAFLILSISMAIASQTLAIAVRSYRLASERQDMLTLMQSLRAEALPKLAMSDLAQEEGEAGVFRWKIRLLAQHPAQPEPGQPSFAIISAGKKNETFRQNFLVTLPARIEPQ
ncbi:pilus assembly FimT family protein [Rhizobium laguerreae]|uniref:pilus assembly FimT family protein n=1 Tax=Rhizobium laguerreae TaxID=1076926 RepID=UPI001C900448|nr:type II secretion system protein [Rhizobium laguerreae]MBY3136115.1 type II secretion system protein [Rhizobium laguerreae]